MRKTLAALLITAALPVTAMAMSGPGGDHRFAPDAAPHGEMRAKHEGGEHRLTREQRKRMDQIMKEERKAHQEIHQRYLGKLPQKERDAMQKELVAAKDKAKKDSRAVLTPEQQKRMDEMHEKAQQHQQEWKEFQDWKASKAK